ncbi:hypothetical protein SeMB42_g00085 [Synchytrium endobioticum]|uniref:Cwf18 pre-mRNA splicing factor n=1 Tax=Synchytrium endobioticum TaxID=286115 RepID=A0A507DJ55_9FUNG|nr:hypothetical protein SeLEV6574_g00185 [Synchytrium endobioticum]TPX54884.1 hypothetical protein SeMB42_g00085 [Synchytrium endobioticum]
MDLEAQAKARRAKLEALKARQAGASTALGPNDATQPLPNHRPLHDDPSPSATSTVGLKRRRENGDADTDGTMMDDLILRPSHLEAETAEFAKEALESESQRNKELDLSNLAPKKPNWDLKRDLERKIAKLERRTQVAIIELIRNRLTTDQDMASVIGAGGRGDDDSDEDD